MLTNKLVDFIKKRNKIDDSIENSLKKEVEEKENVAKAPSDSNPHIDQLKLFVQKNLDQGKTSQEIKDSLQTVGWKEDIIQQVYSDMNLNEPNKDIEELKEEIKETFQNSDDSPEIVLEDVEEKLENNLEILDIDKKEEKEKRKHPKHKEKDSHTHKHKKHKKHKKEEAKSIEKKPIETDIQEENISPEVKFEEPIEKINLPEINEVIEEENSSKTNVIEEENSSKTNVIEEDILETKTEEKEEIKVEESIEEKPDENKVEEVPLETQLQDINETIELEIKPEESKEETQDSDEPTPPDKDGNEEKAKKPAEYDRDSDKFNMDEFKDMEKNEKNKDFANALNKKEEDSDRKKEKFQEMDAKQLSKEFFKIKEKIEDIQIDVDKEEGKFELEEDVIKSINESMRDLSQQIGEVRQTVLSRERYFNRMESDYEKMKDDIKNVRPQEITKEFEKKEIQLTNVLAETDKLNLKTSGIDDKLKKFLDIMGKIQNFESVLEVLKETKENVNEVVQNKEYISMQVHRVEMLFKELQESTLKVQTFESSLKDLKSVLKHQSNDLNNLNAQIKGYPKKAEIKKLQKDFDVLLDILQKQDNQNFE